MAERTDVQPQPASHPYPLRGVPNLPPHYIPRPESISELVAKLREHVGKAVSAVDDSQAHTLALHGMGGLGKTVLANAVAREVAGNFRDGVLWVTVGREPRIDMLLADMARALGFANATPSYSQLKLRLSHRQILLVLDDVWSTEQLQALTVVSEHGCLLVTTRNRHILAKEVEVYCPEVLTREQSLALLAGWTRTESAQRQANEDAVRVAEACGFLPLALAMIGAMAGADLVSWPNVLARLEAANPAESAPPFPDQPTPQLLRAMDVSMRALPADLAALCADLAVFPESVWVPEAAVQMLWGVHDAPQVRTRLGELAARSLLMRDEAGCIQLHLDLQRIYVQGRAERLPALHAKLVDAYTGASQGRGFAAAPDDGYMFRHLLYHLACSGRADTLAALLLDYAWLHAKLRATSLAELLADFAFLDPGHAAHREAMLVQHAVRLASHVLAVDPDQLSGQLVWRLLGLESKHERLGRLVLQIHADTRHPWLSPIRPTLTAAGGPLLQTFEVSPDPSRALVVMPDGKRALYIDNRTSIKLLDLASGVILCALVPEYKSTSALALLPDGKHVLSSGPSSPLNLWDLASGSLLRRLYGHLKGAEPVYRWYTDYFEDVFDDMADRRTGGQVLAVLPDGKHALVESGDNSLNLLDLSSDSLIHTFPGHSKSVTAVAVLPDGKHAISASDDTTLKLWNLASGALIRTLQGHSYSVTAVAVLPDGKHAISASDDTTLKLWNLASGSVIHTLQGHSKSVTAVAVLPDGKHAISGSWDATLKLWDLASGALIRTLQRGWSCVRAVAVLPDGKRALSASEDRTLTLWDLSSNDVPPERHENYVSAVAVLPDGKHAISASSDKTLKLWDLASGSVLRTLHERADGVLAVAVLPDGKHAISASRDKTLKLWDLASGALIRTLKGHAGEVTAVAVLPDGTRAVSASLDKTLRLWNLASGSVRRTLRGHEDGVLAVAALPDGKHAISASRDKTLKLWDLASGALIRTLKGHAGEVTAVAVLPDGKRAVSASWDRTLKLWDLASGSVLLTLDGHENWVRAVAALPDGKRALSASDDKTLKLWDLGTGQVIATFTGDIGMSACTVAPDARLILAVDGDGQVHTLRLLEPAGSAAGN